MSAFDKIIGYDKIKTELMQISDMIHRPDAYAALGARMPKGLLLDGEPGLGKTLMAMALMEDSGLPFDYDMVVFFSPTGVQSFTNSMPQFEQGDVRIAAFGPATAKVIRDSGLRLDLEAPTKEFPSMTAAVENYLKRENRVQQ